MPISLLETTELVACWRPIPQLSPLTRILVFFTVMLEPATLIDPETITLETTAPEEAWSQPRLSQTQPGPDVTSCGTLSRVVPAGTPVLVASG